MQCYALVGPSGTGKSHRALTVAYEYRIDAIIDDGLLIYEHKIVAGRSAKAESSKMAAVRRAVFMDEQHAHEVREAVTLIQPKKILVLGTSDNMVKRIAQALGLPAFQKTIRIEEIASPGEIQEALLHRNIQGQHVIPVPTLEVKNRVPVYFVGPLDVFFKKRHQAQKIGEKSVVRPSFTAHGHISIEPRAIAQIAQYIVHQHNEVSKLNKVDAIMENGIQVNIELIMRYGLALLPLLEQVQKEIRECIEDSTRLAVRAVNVRVTGVTLR